jgi:hypothetical protein
VTNRFPPDTAMPIGKLFNPETNEALAIAPLVTLYSPTLASPVLVPKNLSPSGSGHGTERDRRSQGGKKQSYIHRGFVRRPKRSKSFQRLPLLPYVGTACPTRTSPQFLRVQLTNIKIVGCSVSPHSSASLSPEKRPGGDFRC